MNFRRLAQVVRAEQFADADREPAADLVLVARPDPAAGGAEFPLGAALQQPLFFHVIREDDVRVVAQEQRAGYVDAPFASWSTSSKNRGG